MPVPWLIKSRQSISIIMAVSYAVLKNYPDRPSGQQSIRTADNCALVGVKDVMTINQFQKYSAHRASLFYLTPHGLFPSSLFTNITGFSSADRADETICIALCGPQSLQKYLQSPETNQVTTDNRKSCVSQSDFQDSRLEELIGARGNFMKAAKGSIEDSK